MAPILLLEYCYLFFYDYLNVSTRKNLGTTLINLIFLTVRTYTS